MGWGNVFIMFVSTGFVAYSLIHVVERAKKCLDFFIYIIFFGIFVFVGRMEDFQILLNGGL